MAERKDRRGWGQRLRWCQVKWAAVLGTLQDPRQHYPGEWQGRYRRLDVHNFGTEQSRRLGIYSRAELKTRHLQPSKVGDLASTAEHSRRLGIYYRAQSEYWHSLPSKSGDLMPTVRDWAIYEVEYLVYTKLMPSNMSGDLLPIVLVLSKETLEGSSE